VGNTKGTWLPGDPRGFRVRHHDEHVEGDYRNPPPPGAYDERYAREKAKLKHPPVYLDTCEQRLIACLALTQKLIALDVEVVDLAIGRCHMHLLARFTPCVDTPDESSGMAIPELSADKARYTRSSGRPRTAYDIDPAPRELLGRAKKHCSHIARQRGRDAPGGLWAIRGKVLPIRDRAHQVNVARYIRNHESEGAAVWSLVRELEMPERWE